MDKEHEVLIVGAGFSGIHQLYTLRKQNITNVKILEAADKLGGIWYWNNYPGFRVDTHAPEYNLKIDEVNKDWTWSEKFASRDELLLYAEHIDKKLDLSKDIDYNTRVLSAEYNETNNLWKVQTTKGEYKAKYFIICVGFAGKKYLPDIKGLEDFKGVCHHTSAWPLEGVDCKGKRVAVIGTGASGVQVIQELGPLSSHLSVFQRTPNLCIPMFQQSLDSSSQLENFHSGRLNSSLNKRLETTCGYNFDFAPKDTLDDSEEDRKKFLEEVWAAGGFHFWVGGYRDLFTNRAANRIAYDFWAEKTRERIKDEKKRDLLAPLEPPHAFGTKRPSLEMRYYEVCDQPNVDIVDIKSSPIDHISSTSIITSDGKEHGPFDVIVLATGYDTIIGGILSIDIRGKDGRLLKETWEDGIKTYLGLSSSGFPNLFFICGVQSPAAFVNGAPLLSAQTQWVSECIAYLKEKGKETIEAGEKEGEKWRNLSIDSVKNSLLIETNSWYLRANIPGEKREPLCYFGGFKNYLGICSDVAQKGYRGFVIS